MAEYPAIIIFGDDLPTLVDGADWGVSADAARNQALYWLAVERTVRRAEADARRLCEEAVKLYNKVAAPSPAMDAEYWTKVARAAREVYGKPEP